MKNKGKLLLVNGLTALRIAGTFLLIPIYMTYGGIAAAATAAACYATDFLDGFLARKLKASTFFGSFFDGFSDKAFNLVNFLILCSITPLAWIPILFELGIIGVQFAKYKSNMNVQSSMIGKAKMWVAGITMFVALLLVDQTTIDYLSANIISKLGELDKNKVLGATLIPLIISEVATLSGYVKDFIKQKKVQKENVTIYDCFPNYSKAQVDKVLATLSEEERKALIKEYGQGFYDYDFDEKVVLSASRDIEQTNSDTKSLSDDVDDMTIGQVLFDPGVYEKYKDVEISDVLKLSRKKNANSKNSK